MILVSEYYHNIDRERFSQVKPLIWLWMMFDKSPAGRNAHLGFKLRRMLASFIFLKLGQNVKIFHNVEVSFGYNIEVGDNTIIHREVLLDDRGEILIGNNVSISDFVNIYSHSHDNEENLQRDPECRIRKGHAAENFSVLRHIALNLIRQD